MLYIVATPIGNLGDMSQRGLEALRNADVIACEDTRRTRVLLSHFEIPRPAKFVSYREQTEESAGARLIGMLKDGMTVALCSDGGYPAISDPGYRIVSKAIEEELDFEVVPGASAVQAALVASGLPTSSYTFKGYPPKKSGGLRRFFDEEKDMPHTLVFFESPKRVGKALAAAFEVLGDRKAAVCAELTKVHERVIRGYLGDLAVEFQDRNMKGEVTIVVAGSNPKFARIREE